MEETPVRSYDSKLVNLVVDGVAITGFAEGSFIQAERAEDDFTEHVGAQGEVTIAETNNFTGEITFTLDVTSPSNAYLRALASRRGNAAIVPAIIVDANEEGGQRVSAAQCRIRRKANYESSNEITTREWVVFCANLNYYEND